MTQDQKPSVANVDIHVVLTVRGDQNPAEVLAWLKSGPYSKAARFEGEQAPQCAETTQHPAGFAVNTSAQGADQAGNVGGADVCSGGSTVQSGDAQGTHTTEPANDEPKTWLEEAVTG